MNTGSITITTCSLHVNVVSSSHTHMEVIWDNGWYELVYPDVRIVMARRQDIPALRQNSTEYAAGYEVRRDS